MWKVSGGSVLIRAKLEENPPEFIVQELHALEQELQEALNKKVRQAELVRVIIYANANENEIPRLRFY